MNQRMSEIVVREEVPADYTATEDAVRCAFESAEMSDHSEHCLVAKIRQDKSIFVKELSLVATTAAGDATEKDENSECRGETVVGHVLLSKIKIVRKPMRQLPTQQTLQNPSRWRQCPSSQNTNEVASGHGS